MHLVAHNSSMELTPLWTSGKLLFLHDLHVQTFFSALAACFCNEMLCFLLHCSLPRDPYCCSLPSPIHVLASTAHLYMPQLFTHCLPTIIFVKLIYIAYVL